MTPALTLIDGDRTVELRARAVGARVVLEPADVKDVLGWEVHDGLLCNDMMCVPLADEAALTADGGIDLDGLARVLDRPLAVDVEEGAAYLGVSARERARALRLASRRPTSRCRISPGGRIAVRASRQEGAARRLRLLVRVPPRPARVAGGLRGAEGPRLHGHHRRARQERGRRAARGSRRRGRRIPR